MSFDHRRDARKRTTPVELIDSGTTYDARRYAEFLADALNSVTEPFGQLCKKTMSEVDRSKETLQKCLCMRALAHEQEKGKRIHNMLNVRDFDAFGDGATNGDDTNALQAAFNAVPQSGGIVNVPAGIYMVSQPLSLKPKTYLKGAGAGTVFKRTSSGQDVIFLSTDVNDVTVDAISIDINKAKPLPNQKRSWAIGLGFENCSNVQIRDVRVIDGTGTNVCCRHGLFLRKCNNVWVDRNYLGNGLRLACYASDKVVVENNVVEDANDNAITLATLTPSLTTTNYIIRNNIVRAPKANCIYIGDDGFGIDRFGNVIDPSVSTSGIVHQNILVDGNVLIGPLELGQSMVRVTLANVTERLHILNNIMVNIDPKKLPNESTFGISVSSGSPYGLRGADFLIAQNTIHGQLGSGIWVQGISRVRIANNHISDGWKEVTHAIRVGGTTTQTIPKSVDTAIILGNIASKCRNGLVVEDSTNVLVSGNSFTEMELNGIDLTANTGQTLSAQVIGNKVSNVKGVGILEHGSGIFDTHYLFNDLRNNSGGPFSKVNANGTISNVSVNATRVGNLGTGFGRAFWNLPSPLSPGSFVHTNVNVPGARLGDAVAVGFDKKLDPGVILTGSITADDTVTVTLLNMTPNQVSVVGGELRVDVLKYSP